MASNSRVMNTCSSHQGQAPLEQEKAGIERYTPHALRRFYATQAANSGIPLTVLREQLGHADLTTTQRYLAHNAETQRTAAVAASPLSGLLREQGRRRRR